MHKFGAALGDEVGAVFLPQPLHVGGGVTRQHRPRLPVSTSPERDTTYYVMFLEQRGDAAVGGRFIVVGPVRCKNPVSLTLPNGGSKLSMKTRSICSPNTGIEIGHHPAAEHEGVVASSHGPPGACMIPSMDAWAPTPHLFASGRSP